jgi:hypothetical protein
VEGHIIPHAPLQMPACLITVVLGTLYLLETELAPSPRAWARPASRLVRFSPQTGGLEDVAGAAFAKRLGKVFRVSVHFFSIVPRNLAVEGAPLPGREWGTIWN